LAARASATRKAFKIGAKHIGRGAGVADNADMSPDYLKRVRAPDNGYMSVPFAEDVELSMRL
jgi:hypothetical protein